MIAGAAAAAKGVLGFMFTGVNLAQRAKLIGSVGAFGLGCDFAMDSFTKSNNLGFNMNTFLNVLATSLLFFPPTQAVGGGLSLLIMGVAAAGYAARGTKNALGGVGDLAQGNVLGGALGIFGGVCDIACAAPIPNFMKSKDVIGALSRGEASIADDVARFSPETTVDEALNAVRQNEGRLGEVLKKEESLLTTLNKGTDDAYEKLDDFAKVKAKGTPENSALNQALKSNNGTARNAAGTLDDSSNAVVREVRKDLKAAAEKAARKAELAKKEAEALEEIAKKAKEAEKAAAKAKEAEKALETAAKKAAEKADDLALQTAKNEAAVASDKAKRAAEEALEALTKAKADPANAKYLAKINGQDVSKTIPNGATEAEVFLKKATSASDEAAKVSAEAAKVSDDAAKELKKLNDLIDECNKRQMIAKIQEGNVTKVKEWQRLNTDAKLALEGRPGLSGSTLGSHPEGKQIIEAYNGSLKTIAYNPGDYLDNIATVMYGPEAADDIALATARLREMWTQNGAKGFAGGAKEWLGREASGWVRSVKNFWTTSDDLFDAAAKMKIKNGLADGSITSQSQIDDILEEMAELAKSAKNSKLNPASVTTPPPNPTASAAKETAETVATRRPTLEVADEVLQTDAGKEAFKSWYGTRVGEGGRRIKLEDVGITMTGASGAASSSASTLAEAA